MITRLSRLIRRAISAWTLHRANRKASRLLRIYAIPRIARDERGRFVSGTNHKRAALHDRLRQETTRNVEGRHGHAA